MTTKELKHNLIDLIENFNNYKILKQLYELLKTFQNKESEVDFWDLFSEEQKREVDVALEEIGHAENLISNEVVMDRARKCLKK